MKLEHSRQIFEKKNAQIWNFMSIRSVGAELFHADRQPERLTDRQIDRHDEGNSRSSQFCERD